MKASIIEQDEYTVMVCLNGGELKLVLSRAVRGHLQNCVLDYGNTGFSIKNVNIVGTLSQSILVYSGCCFL